MTLNACGVYISVVFTDAHLNCRKVKMVQPLSHGTEMDSSLLIGDPWYTVHVLTTALLCFLMTEAEV